MKPDTNTLIDALCKIVNSNKQKDFVGTLVNAAVRLEKLQRKVRNQRRELEQLKGRE